MSWENEPTTCCASAQGQRPNRRFAASGKNPISATTPRSKARGWFRSRIRATVLQPLAPCAENLQRLLKSYQKIRKLVLYKRNGGLKRNVFCLAAGISSENWRSCRGLGPFHDWDSTNLGAAPFMTSPPKGPGYHNEPVPTQLPFSPKEFSSEKSHT